MSILPLSFYIALTCIQFARQQRPSNQHLCWIIVNVYRNQHWPKCLCWLWHTLFPQGQRRVMDAIHEGRNPAIISCPRCRQRCMKEGRNNHIRCWLCKSHLCYQCKSIISGTITDHYRPPAPCQQHSAWLHDKNIKRHTVYCPMT